MSDFSAWHSNQIHPSYVEPQGQNDHTQKVLGRGTVKDGVDPSEKEER